MEKLFIFLIGSRIIGAYLCVIYAKDLNRSSSSWGLFGFITPLLAMILILFMKPVIKWNENLNIENSNKKKAAGNSGYKTQGTSG